MDLCGPMSELSLGGGRYMMLLIDDYSRMTHVRILKKKSDAFEEFQDYKTLVENELEKKIKTVRTDGGGEFCSKHTRHFLRKHGIKHQSSTPYTPQQNGRVERMNRTIITMAKCMMTDAQLERRFWAEAVNTAVYIKNRISHTAIHNEIPYELWYKKKPDLSNVRVFGCRAFVHIPKEKRKKLDSSRKEMIFLGYSETSKAWRFFNEESNELCLSSEATFNERKRQQVKIPENIEEKEENENEEEEKREEQEENNFKEDVVTSNDAPVLRRSARVNLGVRTSNWTDPAAKYWERAACVHDEESMNIVLLTEEEDFKINPDKWLASDKEEYNQLLKNNTFELVELPKGRKAIGCKIVRKLKLNPDGTINKRKSRIFAQGFSQKFGID
jgi:hypothetical protein